jgi:tRNA threonylcarbamoyladenosine biosynthesis protein TsaE
LNDLHEITSASVNDTLTIGSQLGAAAQPNDVIALTGSLGAGKTHLAKGIAAGLQVNDPRVVNSPTFVLINEYGGRLHMYHVDAYRPAHSAELAALGFEDMCTAGGLVVVEWADKVQDLLPADSLSIDMTATGENSRRLRLTSDGPHSKQLLTELMRIRNDKT